MHLNARLCKTVALVGMMGAGKTAVGTQLSRRLGVPFLDSDEEITRAAAMSVAEIFARDGEAFFRARETEVLRRLLRGPPSVLSTGGGVFLSPSNRALIGARGVSVWLNADLDLLWSRARHRTTRPLLQTDDPYATLRRLHAERSPVYALADITVRAESGLSVEAMAERVHQALTERDELFKAGPDA